MCWGSPALIPLSLFDCFSHNIKTIDCHSIFTTSQKRGCYNLHNLLAQTTFSKDKILLTMHVHTYIRRLERINEEMGRGSQRLSFSLRTWRASAKRTATYITHNSMGGRSGRRVRFAFFFRVWEHRNERPIFHRREKKNCRHQVLKVRNRKNAFWRKQFFILLKSAYWICKEKHQHFPNISHSSTIERGSGKIFFCFEFNLWVLSFRVHLLVFLVTYSAFPYLT